MVSSAVLFSITGSDDLQCNPLKVNSLGPEESVHFIRGSFYPFSLIIKESSKKCQVDKFLNSFFLISVAKNALVGLGWRWDV